MARGWAPERTCIACRKKRPKEELIRLVLAGANEVTPDFEQILGGRGAYLCKNLECLEIFSRPRGFMRPFRLKSPPRIGPGIREDILGFSGNSLSETVERDG